MQFVVKNNGAVFPAAQQYGVEMTLRLSFYDIEVTFLKWDFLDLSSRERSVLTAENKCLK